MLDVNYYENNNFEEKQFKEEIDIKHIEKVISEAILSNDTVEHKKNAIKLELEKLALHKLDWSKYCFIEKNTYTRNAVILNDDFTILILCWSAGCKSKIHNHPCDGCFIVGIEGELKEIKYIQQEDKSLKETEVSTVSKGDICWMHNKLGFHKICTASENENAITLHVYHPPYNVCKGYDLDGKDYDLYPKFYSINGKKVEY